MINNQSQKYWKFNLKRLFVFELKRFSRHRLTCIMFYTKEVITAGFTKKKRSWGRAKWAKKTYEQVKVMENTSSCTGTQI